MGTTVKRIGQSNILVSVSASCADFGLSYGQMMNLLRGLGIDTVYIGGVLYYPLYWLEKAIFIALSPGEPPGCSFEILDLPVVLTKQLGCALTQVVTEWDGDMALAGFMHSAAGKRKLEGVLKSLADKMRRGAK